MASDERHTQVEGDSGVSRCCSMPDVQRQADTRLGVEKTRSAQRSTLSKFRVRCEETTMLDVTSLEADQSHWAKNG
jgi:hypothetical protein